MSDSTELPFSSYPFDTDIYQIPFPDNPIKEGYTWMNQVDNTLLNSDKQFIFKLEEINDNTVVIGISRPAFPAHLRIGKYTINRFTGQLINASYEIRAGSVTEKYSVIVSDTPSEE